MANVDIELTGSNFSDRFLRGFGIEFPLFAREANERFEGRLLGKKARPNL